MNPQLIFKRTNAFLSYFHGLRMFWKGLSFIAKNRLGWFFLFPLLMNLMLWWLGFRAIGHLVDGVLEALGPQFSFTEHWPQWVQWMLDVFGWLMMFLFRALLFLSIAYISGYVVLFFMAPVLSWMAAVTLRIHSGYDTPFSFKGFLADVWRGMVVSVRNFLMQTLFYLLFLLASFIPVIGWLSPVAMFMGATYYYGFSFLDYGLEQHKVGYRQSIIFVQYNRGLAMGIGTLFSLCLAIPYVGIFLGGFLAIVSVVGATLVVTEMLGAEDRSAQQSPMNVFQAKVLR